GAHPEGVGSEIPAAVRGVGGRHLEQGPRGHDQKLERERGTDVRIHERGSDWPKRLYARPARQVGRAERDPGWAAAGGEGGAFRDGTHTEGRSADRGFP